MTTAPAIQILDKSNPKNQFLVPLPDAYPLPPLGPAAIRIQSRILSISTNNFTYALLGHLLGWWNVWTTPPTLPEPYRDTSKYGRISAWGYAEVVESTHDGVPAGSKLWGYLPIGDYPEALEVDVESGTGHVIATSSARQALMKVYNRYFYYPPATDLTADKESRGWDSVMQVLFETSYLLNRYALSWDDKKVNPSGAPTQWSTENADITNAVVILLGASGKTGLAFAHQLRYGRPADKQPKKVVAVGSDASREITKGTGLFDYAVLYSDFDKPEVVDPMGIEKTTKVVLVEFSSRGTADQDWYAALKSKSEQVSVILVGGSTDPQGVPMLRVLAQDPTSGVYQANASGLRDFAMDANGTKAYFDGMLESWQQFKEFQATSGLKLSWGKGMEGLKTGWDSLAGRTVDATAGLVYEI